MNLIQLHPHQETANHLGELRRSTTQTGQELGDFVRLVDNRILPMLKGLSAFVGIAFVCVE